MSGLGFYILLGSWKKMQTIERVWIFPLAHKFHFHWFNLLRRRINCRFIYGNQWTSSKIHTYKSWGDEGSIPISFKKVVFILHFEEKTLDLSSR